MLQTTSVPKDFYAALWVGALRRTRGETIAPFPAELDDLALEFFQLFRPLAKA